MTDDRPAVSPKFQDEVTEENEFLVSHHTIGTMRDDDGNLIVDVSQAGEYIKVRFPREGEDDIKVVYELDELANAAATLADYDPAEDR